MSAPTDVGLAALKRLVRFLFGRKRLVFRYPGQRVGMLECYSDTDWACCPKTRKSTSGGCLMLGSHLRKTWSSTQPSISLSSSEAEYYGVVRAAGTAIGQQTLMEDMGINVGVRVWTDSSAAMGLCGRSGLGRLRHVQTHTLWVQERVRTGAIQLRKVNGLFNPADLFTKHLTPRGRATQLVELLNCEYRDGRAQTAPLLRKEKTPTNDGHAATIDATSNDDNDNNSGLPTTQACYRTHKRLTVSRLCFHGAVAPVDLDGASPDQCICCPPGCGKCYPPRPGEFDAAPSGREAW